MPAAIDPYFPARPAARFEALVTPAWVRAVRDFEASGGRGERPESYGANGLVVIEASWAALNAADAYRAGHVPGAVHLNTDDLEDGYPTWRLRPPDELRTVIGGLGIGGETAVVVYGRQLIAAARAWWVLHYVGVKDVRLLDGGYTAWLAAGLDGEQAVNHPAPVEFGGAPRLEALATMDDVRQTLDGTCTWLADVRSADEYSGVVSGYGYLERKGRIPGAVHLGDADDGGTLSTADGRLRALEEIDELWRARGLPGAVRGRFDGDVIFYCGSGWRSSLAYFCAWLMGHERIRNFSDGWCGWSTVYVRDATAVGATPGWRQEAAGNPLWNAHEHRSAG